VIENLFCEVFDSFIDMWHGHGKTGHASLDHLNPVGYLLD
jgi:hypothetical protein